MPEVGHSVNPLPPITAGGRGMNLLPNFQKGRLDRTSFFMGEVRLLGKRGRLLSGGGGCNKLKSEIFNDKKSF